MSAPTLAQVAGKVGQIPSLSVVVDELLASLANDDLETSYLVSKISQDQALAARVLRVANSPFYGLTSRVSSVGEAVVVLGFQAVRSLALAASIVKLFPAVGAEAEAKEKAFGHLAFWRHAIGTGVGARALAARAGSDPESAFTVGLLHDIGKLVLRTYYPQSFNDVVAYRIANGCLMVEAEQAQLGFDHAQIGSEVARLWHFPTEIQQAIRDHHQPDRAPAMLTDLTHVANVLSYALDIGSGGNDRVPPVAASAWERVGLGWDELGACLHDIESLNASMNLLMAE